MSLRFAILGLLRIHPASGYDLKRAFDTSVAHVWSADQSQIYRTLDRLIAEGLVAVEVVAGDGRPDRRVHSVTDRGAAALRSWLVEPADVDAPREPFLAKLFFADAADRSAALRLLHERRAHVEALHDRLAAITVRGASLGATLRRATLANGIAHAAAELAWIDATVSELDAGASGAHA